MGKKKVEHVVFDGMREIKKKYNISEYNKKSHADKRKLRRCLAVLIAVKRRLFLIY